MRLLKPNEGNGKRADSTMILMLSLYLLLLAFFIVLTTIATIEDGRRKSVLESVVTTFRGEVSAAKSIPKPQTGSGVQEGGASLSDQIESLFKQSLPAVKMERSDGGTVLRLEAPAESLFVRGEKRLSPGRGQLLERLVKALRDREGLNKFFEIRFLHTIAEGEATSPSAISVLRTGVLARRLIDRGIAETNISTGLSPSLGSSSDPQVAFEIYLRPEAVETGDVKIEQTE